MVDNVVVFEYSFTFPDNYSKKTFAYGRPNFAGVLSGE